MINLHTAEIQMDQETISLIEIDEIIAASEHELVASSTQLELNEDLAWLEFFKDRQYW